MQLRQAHDAGDQAVRLDLDFLQRPQTRFIAVDVFISDVGNVLVQRPASGDIQRLKTAANAEQRRLAFVEQAPQKPEFAPVAFAVGRQYMRIPTVAAIFGRVDIGAAVTTTPSRRDRMRFRIVVARRDQQGQAARPPHGVDIRRGRAVEAVIMPRFDILFAASAGCDPDAGFLIGLASGCSQNGWRLNYKPAAAMKASAIDATLSAMHRKKG